MGVGIFYKRCQFLLDISDKVWYNCPDEGIRTLALTLLKLRGPSPAERSIAEQSTA